MASSLGFCGFTRNEFIHSAKRKSFFSLSHLSPLSLTCLWLSEPQISRRRKEREGEKRHSKRPPPDQRVHSHSMYIFTLIHSFNKTNKEKKKKRRHDDERGEEKREEKREKKSFGTTRETKRKKEKKKKERIEKASIIRVVGVIFVILVRVFVIPLVTTMKATESIVIVKIIVVRVAPTISII